MCILIMCLSTSHVISCLSPHILAGGGGAGGDVAGEEAREPQREFRRCPPVASPDIYVIYAEFIMNIKSSHENLLDLLQPRTASSTAPTESFPQTSQSLMLRATVYSSMAQAIFTRDITTSEKSCAVGRLTHRFPSQSFTPSLVSFRMPCQRLHRVERIQRLLRSWRLHQDFV